MPYCLTYIIKNFYNVFQIETQITNVRKNINPIMDLQTGGRTMKYSKEELFSDVEAFNKIYESLFTVFMKGLSRQHKMEYYSFTFGGKEVRGRAILPEINVDTYDSERRACEIFRVEFQETKCYPDYLLKRHFPEMFEEVFNRVFSEDLLAEAEKQVDRLIDSIFDSNFN